MADWLELSEIPELKKKLEQPAPPPKRTPSIAPPQPPSVEQQEQQELQDSQDWVVVKEKGQKEESIHMSHKESRGSVGGSPVLIQKPVVATTYTDNGDEYNDIGLKKVGYSDGGGGNEDYTPGWALSDDTRDKVMQRSVDEVSASEELQTPKSFLTLVTGLGQQAWNQQQPR